MYDIKRVEVEEYLDNYVYKSRNECNQIIVCEVYLTYGGYLNFMFYITSKRKDGYQQYKSTGKDGIKSLVWAKKCLLDFIDFAKSKYKGKILIVHPDDEKRRKVYEYALIPLGFKLTKDRHKSLYMRM